MTDIIPTFDSFYDYHMPIYSLCYDFNPFA